MTNQDGTTSYSLSPHYESTLEADKKAYVGLLRHLKAIDGDQHTVIIMYSPKANALIAQPVSQALLTRMNKKPGTWPEVFGDDADQFFYAWSIASYVGKISAAGKAVHPLPTYENAAIKEPIKPQAPGSYPSGGPTWNVINIYKAAAPHIDQLAPDLYTPESVSFLNFTDRAQVLKVKLGTYVK
jgi:beta-galactosidase GanA